MAKTKTEYKLWLYVIGTMFFIGALWAAVFYPHSLKKYSSTADGSFSDFKDKINSALSVFKKSTAPDAPPKAEEIDSLRERVFGDTTKRAE